MILLQVALLLVSFIFVESQHTFPDTESIKYCKNERNCVEVKACPEAVKHLKIGIRPEKICGFNGKIAKICCGENNFGEISNQKCKEFYRNYKPIPKRNEFGIGKYPNMAALGYRYRGKINWGCVGTLISDKFILTSAQCLNHHTHGEVKIVRLGDINLSSECDDANAKNYKIKKIIPHPYFKLPKLYHDLGLIELQEVVQFNEGVRPACLQSEDKVIPDLVLIGWKNEGNLQEILISDNTDLIRNENDWEIFLLDGYIRERYPKFSNETHIIGEMFFKKGPCRLVDDGSLLGPDNENKENGIVVSAITSLRSRCIQPGIFTKIVPYLPWIETTVWN